MKKPQIEQVINNFKNQIVGLAKNILLQLNRSSSEKKFASLTNKSLITFWRAIDIFPIEEDINVTLVATKVASDIEQSSMANQINNFTRSYDHAGTGLMMDEICQAEIIKMLNGYFLTGNIDQRILQYVVEHI